MRQIILDTETTGLQPEEGHRIIEIGCIELVNRKFTGRRYHQYINPERESDAAALAVHGITTEFLRNKPTFMQIVQEFMDFISGAELLIHNAAFDEKFINHELALTRSSWQRLTDYCRVTDTLAIARQLHIGQKNGLDALCKRYSVDNSQRDFHGALLDAHLLAQVYLAMTGGQGSLFGAQETPEPSQSAVTNVKKAPLKSHQLVVLTATGDELAAHEMKLQKMVEKGKCIWIIPNHL